jgi:hypothetical protein
MLSDALGCSRMLSYAPRSSQMLSNAPMCSQMLSDSLMCSQMLPDPFKCSQVLPDALTCCHTLPRAFIYSQLLWYAFVCVHMLPNALRCSQMLSDAFMCFHMLSDAVRCFHMLSDAFICSQMLPDPLLSFQILPNPPDPLKCRGAACFLPSWVRGRVVCRMSRQVRHCAPIRARKHFACKSLQIHSDAPRCFHCAFIWIQMLSDDAYAIRCSQILSSPCKSPQILANVLARHAFCFCGCMGASFAECRAKSAIAHP